MGNSNNRQQRYPSGPGYRVKQNNFKSGFRLGLKAVSKLHSKQNNFDGYETEWDDSNEYYDQSYNAFPNYNECDTQYGYDYE